MSDFPQSSDGPSGPPGNPTDSSSFGSFYGWYNDPNAHARARAEAGLRDLSSLAPRLMRAGADVGDIMLYKAWADVLGNYPSYPAQLIGDCESFGHSHGNDLLECVDLALSGKDAGSAYRETCTEALYAAGREAGNMLGGGDGCYGSAMAKAMTTMGMVPREAVGTYSGQRAKQWGRTGMPDEVRSLAATHKLGAAAAVTTVDEAKAALAAGSPVSVSSDIGFQGNGGFARDAKGIAYQGGSWPHCMLIVGHIESDGVPTFVISQSWGDDMPKGPQPFSLPKFCFRALASTVARMLGQNDSYALSKGAVFVPRPLPARWTNKGWAS